MNFQEFGLILFTENYESCVSFYRDTLNLPVRNVKPTLVSFDLPHGYLMVEKGGAGNDQEKARHQNPTVIRFDVEDLDKEVRQLEERGAAFKDKRLAFDWGTIAVLTDPDGNRIELGELNETSASMKD